MQGTLSPQIPLSHHTFRSNQTRMDYHQSSKRYSKGNWTQSNTAGTNNKQEAHPTSTCIDYSQVINVYKCGVCYKPRLGYKHRGVHVFFTPGHTEAGNGGTFEVALARFICNSNPLLHCNLDEYS